jgi:hypothetical protein
MKTAEIILKITYDEKYTLHPRRWDWKTLVIDGTEKIEVLPEPRHEDELEVITGDT